MARIILPENIQDRDPLDPARVMADFRAIVAETEGKLQAAVNVEVGSPADLDGYTSTPGSGTGLARANHMHVVRGVEHLAADPTTGNFIGREFFNTITGKKRLCIDAAGVGTFVTLGPLAADELAVHASRHASGGADALPNVSVSGLMLTRSRVYAALGSLIANLSTGAYPATTVIAMTLAAAPNAAQNALIMGQIRFNNQGGAATNVSFRVRDTTNNVTIMRSGDLSIGASTGLNLRAQPFVIPYTLPARVDGLTAIEIQARADVANVQVSQSVTSGGDTGDVTWIAGVVG